MIVDNIGLPARVYNYAFMDGTAIGVNDGVILVALKEGHAPTADYVKKLRQALPAAFPEDIFYFQPADIATQILNFGIPTQIDVRTVGYDRTKNLAVAKDLRRRMAAIPGLVDVHLQQELDGPDFFANIDRARATQFGLTATTIANDINISLSSSEQVTPNFWTDPANGIPYYLAVQTPEHLETSLNELKNTPIGAFAAPISGPVPGLLSNVATFKRDTTPTNLNQANIQPLYEILANTQGRDLGAVVERHRPHRRGRAKAARARQSHSSGGPDRQHERSLPQYVARARVRGDIRLPADGRQLSDLGRPVRRDPGAACDALRRPDHAVRHGHDAQRSVADGYDHGGRRRFGEFDPAGHLCARAAACRKTGARGRGGGRRSPEFGPC